jgi:hypothetical protein
MKPFAADLVKDSKRLLREVVKVCADFPQRYKFILADRMYGHAIDGLLRCQEAARLGERRAAEQLPLVEVLIEHNDKLQALIDVAYDLRCFNPPGPHEQLVRLAAQIGAKSGGWKKQIKAAIEALPRKQNPAPSKGLERLGALSTAAASSEAKS